LSFSPAPGIFTPDIPAPGSPAPDTSGLHTPGGFTPGNFTPGGFTPGAIAPNIFTPGIPASGIPAVDTSALDTPGEDVVAADVPIGDALAYRNALVQDTPVPSAQVPNAPVRNAPAPQVVVHNTLAPSASAFGDDDDDEDEPTVFAPRVAAKYLVWGLDLPEGARRDLQGDTVVGRRPKVPEDLPVGTKTLRISEPGKMISRSHALLRVDGDTLQVVDLDSANGTAVICDDGTTIECEPHQPVTVEDGSTIFFAEYSVVVSRKVPTHR
jgi:hypothetical protein